MVKNAPLLQWMAKGTDFGFTTIKMGLFILVNFLFMAVKWLRFMMTGLITEELMQPIREHGRTSLLEIKAPRQAQNLQSPHRASHQLPLGQRQQGLVLPGRILPTIYSDRNELPIQIVSWLGRTGSSLRVW